jgi:hypothetical protein
MALKNQNYLNIPSLLLVMLSRLSLEDRVIVLLLAAALVLSAIYLVAKFVFGAV